MTDDLIDPTPELPDDTPIEKLRLPTRVEGALSIAGFRTMSEVRALSDADLLLLPKFGKASADYIRLTFGLPSHAGVRPRKG